MQATMCFMITKARCPVVKLTQQSATLDLFPISKGSVTAWGSDERRVTSIAPFVGQDAEVSKRLAQSIGAGFPLPNRRIETKQATLLWVGQRRALLIGREAPDLRGLAAVINQTGAETVVRIEGRDVEAVLACAMALDLRRAVFVNGTAARSYIGQMPASVSRISDTTFELRVPRSMATDLAFELDHAMSAVASR